MAESSKAQSTPKHPSETTDAAVDSRNDEVGGDESAPLLSSDHNVDETQTSGSSSPNRSTHVLTSLALSSSVLTIVFLIVTAILIAWVHGTYYLPWQVSDSTGAIAAPVRFRVAVRSVSSLTAFL